MKNYELLKNTYELVKENFGDSEFTNREFTTMINELREEYNHDITLWANLPYQIRKNVEKPEFKYYASLEPLKAILNVSRTEEFEIPNLDNNATTERKYYINGQEIDRCLAKELRKCGVIIEERIETKIIMGTRNYYTIGNTETMAKLLRNTTSRVSALTEEIEKKTKELENAKAILEMLGTIH